MKAIKVLLAALFALMTGVVGTVCAGALGYPAPITANEGNMTVWIFAGVIGIAAVAGIVYFIIQNKKK